MLWEGSWKGPQGIWKANVELGSSCKVMLMVISCISLIPMDGVEKHSWQRKRSPGAKRSPRRRLGGVWSWQSWEMSPQCFQGRFCQLKGFLVAFPHPGETSSHTSASHPLPAASQGIFIPWDGGVWGLTGTAEGQEGSSEEWEVQEVVLGRKPRGLGGNIVQIPPRDI